MPAPTVAFELYDAIYRYLEQQGIAESALCAALGIRSRRDGMIHERVPLNLFEQAFVAAEELTGDSVIGLRMGQAGFPPPDGVFRALSIAGPNVREIMAAFTRYFPLAYDFINLDLRSEDDALKVRLRYPHRRRPHRHVLEHLLAGWYMAANQLTFDELRVPRVVYVQHLQLCPDDVLVDVFHSTPVRFGQAEDGFDVKVESLDYHTGQTDEDAFRLSERKAEDLLLRLRANDRIAREISTHVEAMLEEGLPTLEAVARRMNCSGRTLQRRLAERHLNYQMLLDRVRQDVAVELLANTSLPITRIAERIGFTDDSTFHRAFKRWTGQSPGAYRLHAPLAAEQ